jgi:hypothetical protein
LLEAKKRCRDCAVIFQKSHEFYKRVSSQCLMEEGVSIGVACHLFLTKSHVNYILCVFYDFKTTKNTPCTDMSFERVPNPLCPAILRCVRGRKQCGLS